MRKVIVRLFAVLLVTVMLMPQTVFAAEPNDPGEPVTPPTRYNNTISTATSVKKQNNQIRVIADFEGYSNLVTYATIEVYIREYTPEGGYQTYPGSTHTYTFTTYYGTIDDYFPFSSASMFLVRVIYTVYGTGGDPDVISYNKILFK